MSEFADVEGVGQLPTIFIAKSKNVDFDERPDANSHNEGRINTTCKNDSSFGVDIFRDSFAVKGQKQLQFYEVTIGIRSVVKVPLWNRGRVHFIYNEQTKKWKMRGELDGREWKFCDPYGVINRVIDGLRCMGGDKNIDDSWRQAINTLEKSLSENRASIAKEAPIYTKSEDCNYTYEPESEYVNGPDGEVPWW